MNYLRTDELVPGMKLGKNVYNEFGNVLLPEKVELTTRLIDLLMSWEIEYVIVEDEPDAKIRTRGTRQRFLIQKYEDNVDEIVKLMEGIKGSKNLDFNVINEVTQEVMEFASNMESIKLINEMKSKDKYTYQHSLNVSVYAYLISKWLDYDPEKAKQISMASILHDVGKMKVPERILKKPGKLTEDEWKEVKRHPEYGYDLICNSNGFDKEIALAVLQHHERNDGSGYPFGLFRDNISESAKIIAVADTFDAITSDRVYDRRRTPFAAVEEIRNDAFRNLDPNIALMFYNKILNFFIGSKIMLSNGEIGDILLFNKENFNRPLVKLGSKVVDLAKERDKEIVDVLIMK